MTSEAERLRLVLHQLEDDLKEFPIDLNADPMDQAPKDRVAWAGGIMYNRIRAALDGRPYP